MDSCTLSVLFPVRNIEQEIGAILRLTAEQTQGINTEFIVADMGSTDKTVWEALRAIKELRLSGSVLQSGEGTVARALNTAMVRAAGEYVSFVFARRLYSAFLAPYCERAHMLHSDIVFGTAGEPFGKEGTIMPGSVCLQGLLEEKLPVDIAAVLLRRAFLEERRLIFAENCEFGYSEEFLLRCFCTAETAVRSPVALRRDSAYELRRGPQKTVGAASFQRVEALLRVTEYVESRLPGDKKVSALLWERRIPQAVMWCVDLLLREGNGYGAVQGMLKVGGYRKYLKCGSATPFELKKRIRLWKSLPWMYKPRRPVP